MPDKLLVDELRAKGGSKTAIVEEGEELLSARTQEFGEDFEPAPGSTNGDLIRGQIPTIYNPPTAAPARPSPTA